MGERDARAQDGQIQVQSDRGGSRQQGRAHRLRTDDEGRPVRRSAGRGLNERGYLTGSFRRRGRSASRRRRSDVNQRKKSWRRYLREFGGLAKVDRIGGYAAKFSRSISIA